MKLRLALVAALALLASLATVASASAACAAKLKAGCIEVETVLTLELLVTGKKEVGTTSILVANNPKVTIECKQAIPLENALAENGVTLDETEAKGIEVLKFDILFEECSVAGKPECEIGQAGEPKSKTIETALIVGSATTLVEEEAEKQLDVGFTPEAGTEFATIKIENCEAEATVIVKTANAGEVGQLCTVPKPGEPAKVKLLICKTSGSALLVGGLAATFTLTEELEAAGKTVALKLEEF
jgi:hypothetical protein